MNRSLIAILSLTTTLGAVNFAGATDPQPPARTGGSQPARTLVEVSNDGHPLLVQYRVEKGANINATGFFGRTALMEASSAGRLPVVQYLVNNGADVNAQDYSGSTALMAASYGHLPIVQYLVDKGADVHAKDNSGSTALMAASRAGRLPTVCYLVKKGADINAQDQYGETARDLVNGRQKQAIIDFLDMVQKWDAQVKAIKDGGFLTDPAKTGMNAQELNEFKDAITCPLTLDIMRDPVRTKTTGSKGQEIYTHAYEWENLEAWLKQSTQDPSTRKPKNINDYEPDTELVKRIQEFMDKHVPQEKP